MFLYPADAKVELEYDKVLDIVGQYLMCDLSKALLHSLEPKIEASVVRKSLQVVREAMDLEQRNKSLPISPIEDISVVLEKIKPANSVIELSELIAILYVIKTYERVYKFISRLESKSDYGNLLELISKKSSLSELESFLEKVIDPEGNMRDSASDQLSVIRRSIRKKEAQLNGQFDKSVHKYKKPLIFN